MKAIAFDWETKGFDWWDQATGGGFLVTWADENGTYSADVNDVALINEFREAVAEADTIIGHNLKFDVHVTRSTLGFDPIKGKRIADTETMARLLYPDGARGGGMGFGLKPLSKLYLDPNAADPEDAIKKMAKEIGLSTIKQQGAYYEVYRSYPSVMTEYALMDARYTYDLWDKWQGKLAADERLSALFLLEMRVMYALIDAEEYGILTDQAKVAKLKKQFKDELRTVKERLSMELGDEALGGPGSEEAMIEALLGIGVPLTQKSPNGKLATNKYALQPFAKDFPIIDDLFEMRKLDRFLSTYIGALDGQDVVHTSIQPIGAWTGRMSSRSPNFQNLPARAGTEIRSVLVPRDGKKFVVFDLESVEIRLLAYYLGNEEFKRLVVERDSHAWMASQIWGGEPDDYSKSGPKSELRSLAKNMLFAITYGAGGPRIRSMLLDAGMDATVEQAKSIISTIKQSLPNYYRLMKRIRTKIESVGYVNTITGRKNPVSKDKSYVGLNAIVQGSAADVLKEWLVNSIAMTPESAQFLLPVHDEIVFECDDCDTELTCDGIEIALQQVNGKYGLELAASGGVVEGSYANAK